jgi:hypothetical protein
LTSSFSFGFGLILNSDCPLGWDVVIDGNILVGGAPTLLNSEGVPLF